MEDLRLIVTPAGRIHGPRLPERLLLLGMADRMVAEVSSVWRISDDGWAVEAQLVQRHDGSEAIVLRGTPTGAACERRSFPWDVIDVIARRIARELWQVTAVVPDVASAPPVLEAPETSQADGRLSA